MSKPDKKKGRPKLTIPAGVPPLEPPGASTAPVQRLPEWDSSEKPLIRSVSENGQCDTFGDAAMQEERLREFMKTKESLELVTTELKDEDFERLCELGAGNGGVVMKVRHKPSRLIMARKLIHLEVKADVQKQISSELKVLHKCQSPYIVGYYGAFLADSEINVCMEHMDGGSLDLIVKRCGRIPENIILKITYSVLQGLKYLREDLRIIHRDVKPSNILVNSQGEIKMCDFGVSGQLTQGDSMVMTFVGTRSYMAPERLQGVAYSIQSDIWSLGVSLLEIAVGIFPIPPPSNEQIDRAMAQPTAGSRQVVSPVAAEIEAPSSMSIFELLECIVNDPAPKLPARHFADDACRFIDICLQKEPKDRATLNMLLEHEFVVRAERTDVNVASWVKSTMETSF